MHIRFLSLVLVCSSVAGTATAQMTRGYITLESKIGWSDSVYRGTITSVAKIKEIPKTIDPKSSYSPRSFDLYQLTVRVDETIKGPSAKTITLAVETVLPDECYQAYAKKQTSFLFFLMPKNSEGTGMASWVFERDVLKPRGKAKPLAPSAMRWDMHRLGPQVPEHKNYSDGDGINLFTMDFRVLATPETILEEARAFAKKHPGILNTVHFDIPRPLADLCGLSGDGNSIYMPVVPELEATALCMIKSPGTYLLPYKHPENQNESSRLNEKLGLDMELRHGGIVALASFKSEANIDLLKTLLKEPLKGLANSPSKKVNYIQTTAYKVLHGWGVEVRDPLLN